MQIRAGRLEVAGHSVHQKLEIPEIKTHVKEYKLLRKRCAICGRVYKAKLDNYEVLGNNAKAIISTLGGFFNNSKRSLKKILSQIFGLDVSLGLISKTEERVSKKLKGEYENLHRQVQEADLLCIDETGHKSRNNKRWCWFFGNKNVSFFKLANSRGAKVLKAVLPGYLGNVISDRYAAYSLFNSSKRQVCLAHLRRDFKRFAHSSSNAISEIGMQLLDCIDLVFDVHNGYSKKKISKEFYERRIRKIKKKMYHFLKKVCEQYSCARARNIAKNMLRSFDMMWLFVDNQNIEPTNNFAERQIKHHVKYRKNSYHTWSNKGGRFL